MIGALLVISTFAADAIDVRSTSSCPTAALVGEQLRSLSPGSSRAAPLRAEIVPVDEEEPGEIDPQQIEIRLTAPDGTLLETRRLARGTSSCLALAAAVAVILTTWERDLLPPVVTMAIPRPPLPPDRLGFDVAAGLLVSIPDASPAVGGLVTASLFSSRLGLGARLAGWGTWYHASNGPGVPFEWTHLVASLGPSLRLSRSRWHFDLHTSVALTALIIAVRPLNYQETTLDAGFDLGVRVSVRFGVVAPFAGVAVAIWPTRHVARSMFLPDTILPPAEVLFTLGLALGR